VFIHATRARATATVLAMLALAGCSKETSGSPGPSNVGSTASQLASSSPGGNLPRAPAVKNPLNAAKFISNPCLTVTQSQIQQFGSSEPGESTGSGVGAGCLWHLGQDGLTGVSVSFIPEITDGLTHIYKQNAANFFKDGYFSPLDISGYPAAYNEVADNRNGGQCGLTVGFSDQSIFSVLIQGHPNTDGCKAAVNITKAALQTIQGSQ
jgi:hypothetical protein